ncbi:hypothetical protein [Nocardia sp. NPDC057455]|uniref:hypothetical protein n=1 Tax=Nocardia sp. NPDC057455 TaxID=3346138 RepID=UPI003670496C
MDSNGLRDELTQLLAEHVGDSEVGRAVLLSLARDAADAVLSEFALVKLPEMVVDEWGMKSWLVGGDSEGRPRVQIEDDGRISILSVPNPARAVEQALSLAAALIAAAQHVQERNIPPCGSDE